MSIKVPGRPICCSQGCNKPVACITGRVTDPAPRWRVTCGHCHNARGNRGLYAKGVTPFVTGICSNKDGHLGFDCWTDFVNMPKDYKGRTQIDHIDGNPNHNNLSNLDELCQPCHSYKGQRNGDHNGWKGSSRRFKKEKMLKSG